MPRAILAHGQHVNFPIGAISGTLEIYGDTASYSVNINNGGVVGPLEVSFGPADTWQINGAAIAVQNNVMPHQPPRNLLLVW